MRLKQIKLAGFKSFVDPTTVPFPDNLTAIVGPNGCGKSNLIDAVRWVMGESSAKHLRGDSMTDVIFNGSTARKPVGQASIELMFDNSDGTLTGEYASYAEIAIRRTVSRDGTSQYYLNGTKCRRKDITGIFLGTGLGPRSYAIIEQGMISRLIESKPQELRVFIEEAAGISKYKERRRETETRIRHTRENMERLTDIREELGKQLAHLQRQAKAAAKYKEFKQEERNLKSELSALKWQQYNQQVEALTADISKLETELEARIADQRHADKQIEQTRENHIELSDEFNSAQGRYYGIGADIARLEQGISHRKERQVQLNQDFEQVSSSLNTALEQMTQDEQALELLNGRRLEIEPELEIYHEKMEQALETLTRLETEILEWEQNWEDYNKISAENSQKMEVERTRIQHFERVIERLAKRIENNEQETLLLNQQPIEEDVMNALVELSKVEQDTENLSEHVEQLFEQTSTKRKIQKQHQISIDECRGKLQNIQSQHIALQAVQQAAFDTDDKGVVDWLEQQQLSNTKKLAQSIQVDKGWESSVEMVLGDFLEAYALDDLNDVCHKVEQLTSGKLVFVGKGNENTWSNSTANQTLASKVKQAEAVLPMLEQVLVADSLDQAINSRATLKPHQSIITADGYWLGKNWLRVAKKKTEEKSLLERETELSHLADEMDLLQEKLDQIQQLADTDSEALVDLENQWQQKQKELSQKSKLYSDLRAQVGSQQAKMEQMVKRKDALAKEKVDLEQQLKIDEKSLSESRVSLEALVDAMADDLQQRESLSSLRESKRQALEEAKNQSRTAKDKRHEFELQIANIKAEINSNQSTNQRMHSQVTEMQTRKISLQKQLEEANSPQDDLALELEQALDKRIAAEKDLSAARDKLEEVEKLVRVYDKTRSEAEQAAQAVRSRLEGLRMQWSENTTKQTTQEENISQHDEDIEQILSRLDEEATQDLWLEKLEKVAAKIQRLGAINLAAIEEHKEQSERKIYLDAQHEDLDEALQSLESAIRKIDKETRTRFKETFDQINAGIKELFPKVFGGGHAYLEMTGDDLLDTGVTVMARPPGKRNSTIHLLSGGEKALTALSLVFSIFRLNPAPFCMLDEVDAPLDDANVGRFCKLVKEMSEHLQFIYITHNKVTMEMAHSLAGVTMQEPGASRLVAVDVDEAAKLAGV
ncbi:MAG: chromosome segregation protein SMC [Enterobacterales bacterium]|nr:chromosome segregation protein SMC [Enterobacterales bacterium]